VRLHIVIKQVLVRIGSGLAPYCKCWHMLENLWINSQVEIVRICHIIVQLPFKWLICCCLCNYCCFPWNDFCSALNGLIDQRNGTQMERMKRVTWVSYQHPHICDKCFSVAAPTGEHWSFWWKQQWVIITIAISYVKSIVAGDWL